MAFRGVNAAASIEYSPGMKPRAVLFDAYGTLFDVYSVALQAEQLFPQHGERLAVLWRDKQIEYTRLVSMSGSENAAREPGGGSPFYRPFWDITRSALRHAAERLQLPLDAAAEALLMDAYRHLSAFPENREVLVALQGLGVPTGILSNGDPGMLNAAVQSAGFSELLQHVISVHSVRRFKTDPAAYALGAAALGLPAKDILFVSSNAWDAIAATWYGYRTLWVNRAGAPLEALGTTPTHTGRSLRDVLPLFTAAAPAAPPQANT
jgi:2-haloacid dehalogenase